MGGRKWEVKDDVYAVGDIVASGTYRRAHARVAILVVEEMIRQSHGFSMRGMLVILCSFGSLGIHVALVSFAFLVYFLFLVLLVCFVIMVCLIYFACFDYWHA